MWTKRLLVQKAFEQIALAGYVFDTSPAAFVSAISSLDAMMASWQSVVTLPYNRTVDPKNSDPDQDSGLPDSANEAVYMNLAIRLAGSWGKALSVEVKAMAKEAYDRLLSQATSIPPEMQRPGRMPRGAGHKRFRRSPFYPEPREPLTTGPDGTLDFD